MQVLEEQELAQVAGGESALAHDAIGVGIIMGGLATGNGLIVALGVVYLATD